MNNNITIEKKKKAFTADMSLMLGVITAGAIGIIILGVVEDDCDNVLTIIPD